LKQTVLTPYYSLSPRAFIGAAGEAEQQVGVLNNYPPQDVVALQQRQRNHSLPASVPLSFPLLNGCGWNRTH